MEGKVAKGQFTIIPVVVAWKVGSTTAYYANIASGGPLEQITAIGTCLSDFKMLSVPSAMPLPMSTTRQWVI